MSNERLFRKSITMFLAEPEAFADVTAPTSDELNGPLVYNITCALWEDDTEFTLGDPDTDDGLTFCSNAGDSTPTFDNPTIHFTALRDADRTATGVFNLALGLLLFPDKEFVAGLRLGPDSDVDFDEGDVVSLVEVKTDYGVDTGSSGENARISQTFLPSGIVNFNYTLAA